MTTIFQAEMSGTVAGMSSDAKREVPEEFSQSMAAREAWEDAFDKMRQSLRGTPVEAPKGMKVKPLIDPSETKKPRKAKEPAQEAPKVVQKPKSMDDIALELHPDAMEYA